MTMAGFNEGPYRYANISSNGTTTLRTTAGILHSLIVTNAGSSWVVTIYDNTAGSGTTITTLSPPTIGSFIFDIGYGTGLTIVASGTTAGNLTLCWS